MRYKYTMEAYRLWDGQLSHKSGSNSLDYFNRFKNKRNFRIVIKHGKEILYDERRNGECGKLPS